MKIFGYIAVAVFLFLVVYMLGDAAHTFYKDLMVFYNKGDYEDMIYKVLWGVLLLWFIGRKEKCKCKEKK